MVTGWESPPPAGEDDLTTYSRMLGDRACDQGRVERGASLGRALFGRRIAMESSEGLGEDIMLSSGAEESS